MEKFHTGHFKNGDYTIHDTSEGLVWITFSNVKESAKVLFCEKCGCAVTSRSEILTQCLNCGKYWSKQAIDACTACREEEYPNLPWRPSEYIVTKDVEPVKGNPQGGMNSRVAMTMLAIAAYCGGIDR